MTQQIVNRYLCAGVLTIIRQVICDFAVEPDFALLNQLQYQSRCELLGDRTQSEFGVGRIGNIPFHVGQAETLLVNDLSIFGH